MGGTVTGEVQVNVFESMAGSGTNHQSINNNSQLIGNIEHIKPMDETYNLLSDSMGKLNDVMKKVIESFKIFNQQLEQNNQRNNFNQSSNNANNFFQKNPLASKGISAFSGALGIASSLDAAYESYTQAYSTGDIMGAKANAWKSGGSIAQGFGGTLLSTGAMLSGTPVGIPLMIVGGALEVGGVAANMVGNHKETEKTQAQMYESYLPSMSKFLASYGDSYLSDRNIYGYSENGSIMKKNSVYDKIYDKDGNLRQAKTNDTLAMDFIDVLGKSDLINTGLATTDYLNYMSSLRKYGVNDYINASDITRTAAVTSRAYGGNINTELDFMGTIERFNGAGSGTRAFGKALDIEKLKIDKGQLDEILQGIQSSIEDGVAKGYTRNAEELVDTLAMFAQASGGSEFWTGKQGASRLQQMQSGLSAMSNMDSTESMIVYRAFDNLGDEGIKKILAGKKSDGSLNTENSINYLSGSSYLNTMAAIESGKVDGESLKSIFSGLDSAYGGDRNSIVESLKKIFGLNTQGAIQLYNMRGNLDDTTLTEIMKNPELTDGETQKMNVMNDIKNETAAIGSKLDEIWKGGEKDVGRGGLSALVQRQSFNDMIAFLDSQSELAGLGGLKETLLPSIQQDAITGENYDKWEKFIREFYAHNTQIQNATLLDPNIANGYWVFKIGDNTNGLYNSWNTRSSIGENGYYQGDLQGIEYDGLSGSRVAQMMRGTGKFSKYKDEELLAAIARNPDVNRDGIITFEEMEKTLREIRMFMEYGITVINQ